MRIAATADLHFSKSSTAVLPPLLSQITTGADVLVIAGDITDYGTADEARNFVKDLSASVRIPIVSSPPRCCARPEGCRSPAGPS